ncbi:hypothetical protein M0802_010291 [Mischocyttarus mexicanus]|nr:hypothetical protein M0802_010291 [Mischocyttarus mexicanus]
MKTIKKNATRIKKKKENIRKEKGWENVRTIVECKGTWWLFDYKGMNFEGVPGKSSRCDDNEGSQQVGGVESIEMGGGGGGGEGTYFILYDFIDFFDKDTASYLDRDKFVGIIDTIFKNMSQIERDAIKFQYTDWDKIKDGYVNQRMVADVVGDYFFICPSIHFAQLFADRGMKVYYYFFTQRTSTNLWGKWMGVMHGDEIEYVFGNPLNMSLTYSENERELSVRMIKAFSQFATDGKPTEEEKVWPPYSRDRPVYFIFNAEKKGLGEGLRTTSCAFWNEFLPRLKGIPDPAPETCNSVIASSVSASGAGRIIYLTNMQDILLLSTATVTSIWTMMLLRVANG